MSDLVQAQFDNLAGQLADVRSQLVPLQRMEINPTRKRPSANVTLYVRSDGDDANDGLANTAGRAFATIQQAIDTACVTYDGGPYSVTVQVQDGTWTIPTTLILRPHKWGNGFVLQGNTTTPSNCTLNFTTQGMWGLLTQMPSDYLRYIKGFKVQRSGGATDINPIVCRLGAHLFLSEMDFGAIGAGSHMIASEWSELAMNSAYTVSGGAAYHITADINSWAATGGYAITFTGTPNISRWAVAQRNSGVLHRGGGSLSGLVSILTERYLCQINAFVEGIANMPGAGGTLAWGGQAL